MTGASGTGQGFKRKRRHLGRWETSIGGNGSGLCFPGCVEFQAGSDTVCHTWGLAGMICMVSGTWCPCEKRTARNTVRRPLSQSFAWLLGAA